MTNIVECKSEEGITIGLIDAILVAATVAAARLREVNPDDIPPSVSEACCDLFGSQDLRFLVSFGGNRSYGDSPSEVEFRRLLKDLNQDFCLVLKKPEEGE